MNSVRGICTDFGLEPFWYEAATLAASCLILTLIFVWFESGSVDRTQEIDK